MSLLDSQNNGHTWGLIYIGLFSSGWPQFPCFAPPCHTRDSRYGPQSAEEHQSHGFPWVPWPLGILWWVPPLGTLTLWAVIEENSWHALTPLVHPTTAVFHRWICLVGQHLQLAPQRCQRGHQCCHGSSCRGGWQSNMIWLLLWGQSHDWRCLHGWPLGRWTSQESLFFWSLMVLWDLGGSFVHGHASLWIWQRMLPSWPWGALGFWPGRSGCRWLFLCLGCPGEWNRLKWQG